MNFKVIWLNGMPRSGTNWLSQIFDSNPDVAFRLSPLFSYTYKNRINEESNCNNILKFFNEVYLSKDNFLIQTEKRENGEYPRFKRKETNPKRLVIKDTRYHNLTESLLQKEIDIKFIHIVRNPCAVINSWINAEREFKNKGCIVENDWKTGGCRKIGKEEFWGFNDWVYLTKLYIHLQVKYPQKVMIVKYEDLVLNPKTETLKMFDFSNLEYNKQTDEFLIKSQSRNFGGDYAVYRDKDVKDKWKKLLDKKIISQIYNELNGSPLEKFL
ncbi:MAG: sulfotransferase [Bacteroidales bacterium]|nr:sulfotransferase [Bacteroidales bacterium]